MFANTIRLFKAVRQLVKALSELTKAQYITVRDQHQFSRTAKLHRDAYVKEMLRKRAESAQTVHYR